MQAHSADLTGLTGALIARVAALALAAIAVTAGPGVAHASDEEPPAAMQTPTYQTFSEMRFVEANVLFPAQLDQEVADAAVVGQASSTWEEDWAAGIGDESFIPRRSILTHPWGGDALSPDW